jgi:hypothetical protein
MSRKHFEAIAAALRSNAPAPDSNSYEVESQLFESIVAAVAGACERANPRFDRERFEKASGLEAVQCCSRWRIRSCESPRPGPFLNPAKLTDLSANTLDTVEIVGILTC